MAIMYCKYFSDNGALNFGDDINPMLLGKIFDKSIIESDKICILGIGTILSAELCQTNELV